VFDAGIQLDQVDKAPLSISVQALQVPQEWR